MGGGVVPAIVNTFQQVEYKNQDCELIMERDGQQLDKMQINHSILKPRNCFGHSKNWSYLPQFKLLTLHCEGESTTTTVSWLPRKTQSVIVLAFQSRCQGTYNPSKLSSSPSVWEGEAPARVGLFQLVVYKTEDCESKIAHVGQNADKSEKEIMQSNFRHHNYVPSQSYLLSSSFYYVRNSITCRESSWLPREMPLSISSIAI